LPGCFPSIFEQWDNCARLWTERGRWLPI